MAEQHTWFSQALQREMRLHLHGFGGQPVLVFSCQGGTAEEFEGFGMLEATRYFVESGKVCFFCVDSVDNEAWANYSVHPRDRGQRHEQYIRYVLEEVIPFIQAKCGKDHKPFSFGCSMGGYHAANFFFRYPQLFGGMISLSGISQLRLFIGDYMDSTVYLNSPLHFLPQLQDEAILKEIRQGRIVICVGQGAWEEPMIEDARAMKSILEAKKIPGWVEFWGYDVNHDWPWWRKQLPYFLEKVL